MILRIWYKSYVVFPIHGVHSFPYTWRTRLRTVPPGYAGLLLDGGGGGSCCCTAMRGVQLGIVYWLLCAVYLFAALGSVVASGDSGAAAVQLAASAPALLNS